MENGVDGGQLILGLLIGEPGGKLVIGAGVEVDARDIRLGQAGDALVQTKVDEYMSLLALMVFAFGLSFEFPLILLALQLMGVVSPDTLAGVRRHAIVGIVAVVAIVTPGGDPVSLFALSIPLCIFYEASIWIARLMLGRRAKNREATDTAA